MYACMLGERRKADRTIQLNRYRADTRNRAKTETETYRRRNCYGQESVELILREGRRAIGPALLYVRSRSEKSRRKRSEINVLALQPVFFRLGRNHLLPASTNRYHHIADRVMAPESPHWRSHRLPVGKNFSSSDREL